MLRHGIYLIGALLTLSIPLGSALAADHTFTSFELSDLAWTKRQVQANNEQVQAAQSELLRHADSALKREPKSILDKQGIAQSNNKQDFYSIGKFSWPGDDGDGDVAYIRRDGEKNPEALGPSYDKKNFNEAVRIVNALSLAYYLTNNVKYAVKASQVLKLWFIDPKTRMNPNFRHAAVQPGVNDGSYIGIIEGVVLVEMLDYVALLQGTGALPPDDDRELKAWFGQLSDWLVESDFGKREAKSTNNHGAWYDAQVAAFSLYSGKTERARSTLTVSKTRLHQQFSPNGSMPRELARKNSATYSVYGLRAFVTLARLSDHVGESLWNESSAGQPVLKSALSFLAPYYSGKDKWRLGTVHSGIDQYAIQVFRLGAHAYKTDAFNDVLAYLSSQKPETDRYARLLGPPSFQKD